MSSTYPGDRESAFAVYRRGFFAQWKVVGALLMRELHTRYGRDNIGYLWLIIEPMTLAGAVALLHVGTKTQYGDNIRPVAFTITGYCTFIMFRGMVLRADGALEANMPLLYHRMVTIFDMMLARALLEAAGCIVTLIILLGLAASLGAADLPARPLNLMVGLVLMAWFSFGLSMLVLAATHDNKVAARIVHPATYILMPLSGAFYMMKWIPQPYLGYLTWFPMVQIFEEVRYGVFQAVTDQYVYMTYVIGWCAALTYLGMVSLRVVRRHVHLH